MNLTKKYIQLTFFLCASVLMLEAQVGVNTKLPATVLHIDGGGNNTMAVVDADDVVIDNLGRVGVGMAPSSGYSSKLQVVGGLTMIDGTQAAGRVLTSDASGKASWNEVAVYAGRVELTSVGVDIPYTTADFLQTGTSIVLPPGRYAVNVSMVLRFNGYLLPDSGYFFLRSTFSDSSAASGAAPSPDLEDTVYLSAEITENTYYGFLLGTLIINNSTGVDKRYYYVAGNTTYRGITGTPYILRFGGYHFGEDNIVFYKLSD
ncbi:hypothetical protein [Dysgonomonas macrotermitis]|nr:hypothetical protein [Dysgonomonas macrotermitis]